MAEEWEAPAMTQFGALGMEVAARSATDHQFSLPFLNFFPEISEEGKEPM